MVREDQHADVWAPEAGHVIGEKYILRERIGAGGMAFVFRAEHATLGSAVAVKVLRPELRENAAALHRFHDEGLAASRLAHRNSVAMIDSGTTPQGVPYLVMEFVRGQTLTKLLVREAPLPIPRVANLVGQILAALDQAHAVGVVHADVKSDNVIVETLRDGDDLVKLVDFGLARLPPPAGGRGTISPADLELCGTPEYMAPELIRGEKATAAADLYAVGVILYELLTGATPFAGGAPMDIFARQLGEDVVPPSLRAPGRPIPPALERVVARALAKAQAARFASAAEFRNAVEAAIPPIEPDPTRRCPACDRRMPLAAHFCAECGSPTPLPPPSDGVPEASTDSPTSNWGPVETTPVPAQGPRFARGSGSHPSPDERLRALRATIGDAIARGELEEVAARYLDLAHELAADHLTATATVELEEAIDLLTLGEGIGAAHGPASLWRILAVLAGLYDAEGDRDRARRVAAEAHRHALASHSAVGRDRTRALLEGLARHH